MNGNAVDPTRGWWGPVLQYNAEVAAAGGRDPNDSDTTSIDVRATKDESVFVRRAAPSNPDPRPA